MELLAHLNASALVAVAAGAVAVVTVGMMEEVHNEPSTQQQPNAAIRQAQLNPDPLGGNADLWRLAEETFKLEQRLKLIREERKQFSKGRHPLQRLDRELQQELWILQRRSQKALQHLLAESAIIWDCDERLELQSSIRGELRVLERHIAKVH